MAKRLLISGRVQGVNYREAMRQEAQRLDITGWVRNRRDGSVEAMVDGPTEAVEAIIAWARRGPPSALVTDVQMSEHPGSFTSFERLPTE
ncbi:MAG: acylphosphatase [Betaproteobacteria bacterium RBG_16_64_18]|nr:MAG: acylphosphatase [Betaproteobacteria bacterium RBG_16_64_18]